MRVVTGVSPAAYTKSRQPERCVVRLAVAIRKLFADQAATHACEEAADGIMFITRRCTKLCAQGARNSMGACRRH
jgi:hypothetical protein